MPSFIYVLIGLSSATVADGPKLKRFEFAQRQMGVPFRVTVYARDKALANKAAMAAFQRVAEIDRRLSDYKSDSELNRLCRSSGPGKPVKVSGDLFTVLQHAKSVSQRTDGAFDVSVGGLTKLWRRARRRRRLPDPAELAAARRLVDWKAIHLDRRKIRGQVSFIVELRKPGMRLDLGGIAKGYAADEALAVLKRHGIEAALVNASGDIVAGAPPPGEEGWNIGIAPLDKPDGKPSRFLSIANRAVATSGDAFQHAIIDGKRYSHIVDPKTGIGLTTPSSVTVVARTGMSADALASAVSVLGENRGLKLIEKTRDTGVLIVTRPGSVAKTVESGIGRFEER